MKSTPTPHVATAVTTEELNLSFKGGGPFTHKVTVPAGTRCKKLDGGSAPWVVDDLSFIPNKSSSEYWDADHYGIRVPEDKLTNIQPVERSRARP